MSYSITIDVLRENYIEVITEAFRCLCQNDKPSAVIVLTRVNQWLEILAPATEARQLIEMKDMLRQLKNQLTDLINLDII